MGKRRGQQTTSIVINVTEEQLLAVKSAIQAMKAQQPYRSANEEYVRYLELLCSDWKVEWPEADTTPTEGRDKRGRFVKKS